MFYALTFSQHKRSRTVQKISFTESEGTRMITRTNEGLSVGVDVNIEYKLLPADLKRLHDLVETDYQRLYSSVANSGIRNAVSLYRAQDLLRDTTPLQNDIQTQLSSRFERFGATIIAVQVR